MAIRVYLLDDHELTRRGIRGLLECAGDIEVVGEAGLAAEAVESILLLRPDVAVLDNRLPDGSGIEVCRAVRSADPRIAALILTSYDDDDALFAAIMAGASGYLLKQVRGQDFVETVRRVASGQAMLDPAVTTRVLDRLRNRPPFGVTAVQLTPKEQQVLDLIGEGMTNRQIATARAVIVPIWEGGGTRLKVLEALAAGARPSCRRRWARPASASCTGATACWPRRPRGSRPHSRCVATDDPRPTVETAGNWLNVSVGKRRFPALRRSTRK